MNDQLDEIKVIIVGTFAIGKTSIIYRFLSDLFSEDHVPTVGSETKKKKITNSNGKEVMLYLWDTSGEERFATIVGILYNNSNAVLICFDFQNEDSKNKIDDYVSNAHMRSDGCAFFLVATKIDLFSNERDQINDFLNSKVEYLTEKFPTHQFYTSMTSAKTGEGINELFTAIADVEIKSNQIEIDISKGNTDDKKSGCCK